MSRTEAAFDRAESPVAADGALSASWFFFRDVGSRHAKPATCWLFSRHEGDASEIWQPSGTMHRMIRVPQHDDEGQEAPWRGGCCLRRRRTNALVLARMLLDGCTGLDPVTYYLRYRAFQGSLEKDDFTRAPTSMHGYTQAACTLYDALVWRRWGARGVYTSWVDTTE